MNIFWDAEKYKKDFSFVPQYGEAVMDLLDAAPGFRVVDLGCGNGALTEQLAACGYDVTGRGCLGRDAGAGSARVTRS